VSQVERSVRALRRAPDQYPSATPDSAATPRRLRGFDALSIGGALSIEEPRLAALLERAAEVVCVLDAEGLISYVNPAIESILGFRVKDVIGTRGSDTTHPDDKAKLNAAFESAITDPASCPTVLYRGQHVDGSYRWGEMTVTNLLADPAVRGLVLNIRDVTDRQNTQESIRRQAELLNAVGQPIVAFNRVSEITYWNGAAETTFGWSAVEAMGQNILETLLPAPESEQAALECIQMIMAGDTWTGELLMQARDGTAVPLLISSTPVFEDGIRVSTIMVASDISERVRNSEANARLAAVVGASLDAIFSIDAAGTITTWNPGAATLFGYEAVDVIGRLPAFLDSGGHDHLAPFSKAVIHGGPSIRNRPTRCRRADGSIIDVSVTVSPIRDASNKLIGASIIGRDISERVAMSRQIEVERRRLEDAQRSATLGSFEVDIETGEVTRSAELMRILGLEPNATPATLLGSIHPDDRELCVAAFGAAARNHGSFECTHRIVRSDGETRWVITRSNSSRTPGTRLVTGTVFDVTELKTAQLALEHLAYHDPVTELPNRRWFTARLGEELAAAAISQSKTAVAVIDLDRFKIVNDSFGHGVGDAVLEVVAQRLVAATLPTESLARFGGDEFAIVHPNAEPDDVGQLGDRLLHAFKDPIEIDTRSVFVAGTVGIVLSEPGETVDTAVSSADAAMYEAKRSAKGTVRQFDDQLRDQERRTLEIERLLASDLDHTHLRVVYQPIIDVATGATCGFEALLRCDHPDLGPIPPDEFIPITESAGTIRQVGRWVLRQSLRQLAVWRSNGPPGAPLSMAVNVSIVQLMDSEFIHQVERALADFGIPADALHLELTETVVMEHVGTCIDALNALRAIGVHISIDDFGTGYSSLSYLKGLPVDTLKIDRSFVEGLPENTRDAAIVDGIIHLAKVVDMRVLAEGIETDAQFRMLKELGCDYGQGFLWSKGLSPADADDWLAQAPQIV
jgi:diguanylate cyclase (GGDEF)-like protein/PAS domain S-box-containing protein